MTDDHKFLKNIVKNGLALPEASRNAVYMDFCFIPAGEFIMGSRWKRGIYLNNYPPHRVEISRPFLLGCHPVTQDQFAQWTSTRDDINHQNDFSGSGDLPAERVTWYQAMEYCEWLTGLLQKQYENCGYVATLPTEAQWEYACRAGTESDYDTGDGEEALDRAGWYSGNSGGKTHPVGRKQGVAFPSDTPPDKKDEARLYDMHGNVWEWCNELWMEDAYKLRRLIRTEETDKNTGKIRYKYRSSDPADRPSSDDTSARVFRGGGYFNSPAGCRSAYRFGDYPLYVSRDLGFRVCLVPGGLSS